MYPDGQTGGVDGPERCGYCMTMEGREIGVGRVDRLVLRGSERQRLKELDEHGLYWPSEIGMEVAVIAKDKQHAIKIANEKRTIMKAEGKFE
jgi:hypothetical protein